MEAAYHDCTTLSTSLLHIFAVALGDPEDFFDDKINAHASNLQVANYSSLIVPPPEGCFRKKAHVDSGTLTVLVSDDWTMEKEVRGLI
jgi:isopenicillin N synthase-like dioxygenase